MDAEFNYIRKKQNKRHQFSPNFSFNISGEPPMMKKSLNSTSRYSYQDPSQYPGLANASKQLKQKSCRPSNHPAIGIGKIF